MLRNKSIIWESLYFIRDLRSKEVFKALEKYCQGNVLDVGGGDFHLKIKGKNLQFNSWTILEEDKKQVSEDKKFKIVYGDGCSMPFENNYFDLILNIQVLEHVYEPIKMVSESARVLKKNGYGVFLIPQTANLHYLPHNYYNFTRSWIEKVMKESDLEILELKPLGGFWSTIASRLFYFTLQSIRFEGMHIKEYKRNIFFYLMYPFMILYIIINIPICMLFSLGDLAEEPNNHFILVRKK